MSRRLYTGEEPAALTLGPLTRTDFVRYQGASGDMNPIHHDEPFAQASGYPAPLAVGMFSAGALCAWATDWLGPQGVRRTRIRWLKPCFPGMTLTLSGRVTAVRAAETRDEVDLALVATDEAGAPVVQVWMEFHLSTDAP